MIPGDHLHFATPQGPRTGTLLRATAHAFWVTFPLIGPRTGYVETGVLKQAPLWVVKSEDHPALVAYARRNTRANKRGLRR